MKHALFVGVWQPQRTHCVSYCYDIGPTGVRADEAGFVEFFAWNATGRCAQEIYRRNSRPVSTRWFKHDDAGLLFVSTILECLV